MRNDVAADVRRCEDQPPAVADPARRRAASPARVGIADRQPRGASRLRASAISAVSSDNVSSARRFRKFSILRAKPFCGPPHISRSPSSSSAATSSRVSTQAVTSWPSSGIVDAWDERLGRQHRPELRLDPFALLRCPVERGLAIHPQRAGQLQDACASRRVAAAGACAPRTPRISTGSGRSSWRKQGFRAVGR